MSVFRVPVLGGTLPKPLRCEGEECAQRRELIDPGEPRRGFLQCPGKRTGACEDRAFAYPRRRRTSAKQAEYQKRRRIFGVVLPQDQFHFHAGVDVGTKQGQDIVSVVRGKVVLREDGYNANYSGYGKCIAIEADDSYGEMSGWHFFYAHCSELTGPPLGQTVEEQDVIAKVGRTVFESPEKVEEPGMTPHLHFEVSRTPFSGPTINKHEWVPDKRGCPEPSREDPLEVLEKLGP